jgi:hypothetical protein
MEPIVRFGVSLVDMFKKFVSNTLLSVVVDKKARDKMSAANERKSVPTPSKDELNLPRMSLEKNAAPKKTAKRSAAPDQPAHGQKDDREVLIFKALASAEEELLRNQNRTHTGKPITPERAALIENAIAIRRSKLYILDKLTQDQRKKLAYMAMHVLNDQIDK